MTRTPEREERRGREFKFERHSGSFNDAEMSKWTSQSMLNELFGIIDAVNQAAVAEEGRKHVIT